jgi:hypothetical protein
LAFTKSFVLSLAGGAEPPVGKAHPPALPLHRRQPSKAEEAAV